MSQQLSLEEYKKQLAQQRKEYNKKYYESKRKPKRQEANKAKKQQKQQEKALKKHKQQCFLDIFDLLSEKGQEVAYTMLNLLKNPPNPNINNLDPEEFKKQLHLKNTLNTLLSLEIVPFPELKEDKKEQEKVKNVVINEDKKEEIKQDEYEFKKVKNVVINEDKNEIKEYIKDPEQKEYNIGDTKIIVEEGAAVIVNNDIQKYKKEEEEEFKKFMNNASNNNASNNNASNINSELQNFIENINKENNEKEQEKNKKEYNKLFDDVYLTLKNVENNEIKVDKELKGQIFKFKLNQGQIQEEINENNKIFLNTLLKGLDKYLNPLTKTKEELFNNYIELVKNNIDNNDLPIIYKMNLEYKTVNDFKDDNELKNLINTVNDYIS